MVREDLADLEHRLERSSIGERLCPVARAAGQLVDAWTFVILRELFLGNRRFEALRQHTGMSPRSLALRLARLVDEGILDKQPSRDAPTAQEYRLTEKGLDLWPILIAMLAWGDKYAAAAGPPLRLVHRDCGGRVNDRRMCERCGAELTVRDVRADAPAPSSVVA